MSLPHSTEHTTSRLPLALDSAGPSQLAMTTAAVRGQSPDSSSDVAIGDWDALFRAVRERLQTVVLGCPEQTAAGPLCNALQVRTAVLECAEAMEQLHLTMLHEMNRLQQLELDIFDNRSALAQARAELAGTKAGERRARYLAAHDSLTGLLNRAHFMERLENTLSTSSGHIATVLYLDLDGFKPVNDLHGHATGDELLRIVATRLSRVVRTEDVVGRLGGDEFACLLDGLNDREQLRQLATKVFDAVAAPCKIGPLRLVVRPSIGIAVSPHDGTTATALLHMADAAMYLAKRQQTQYAFVASD
jgi:diguanylate cyclase (GGDEF)-like protein